MLFMPYFSCLVKAKTEAEKKTFPIQKHIKTSVFTGHKSLIDSSLSAVPQLLPRFSFFRELRAGTRRRRSLYGIVNQRSFFSAFAKVDSKSISNNNRMLLLWPVEVKKASRFPLSQAMGMEIIYWLNKMRRQKILFKLKPTKRVTRRYE